MTKDGKWITIKEAQEITGKARTTILHYISKGKVDAKKDFSGHWLIDYLSVPAYQRQQWEKRNEK